MKKSSNKIPLKDTEYDKFGVVSSNECTGLITVPPENEDELENYMEIYDFGPHTSKNSKKDCQNG